MGSGVRTGRQKPEHHGDTSLGITQAFVMKKVSCTMPGFLFALCADEQHQEWLKGSVLGA